MDVYKVILEGESLNFISLVESPAIQTNFVAFSDESPETSLNLSIQDEEKRIILSPVIIPDMMVYRRDVKTNYEYYITFDRDTIEELQLTFFQNNKQSSLDKSHNSIQLEGLTIFSSFITNEELGIHNPKGFEDLPYGTWFVQCKVDNDEVWKEIKEGKLKGLSLSGMFSHVKLSDEQPKQLLSDEELKELYNTLLQNMSKNEDSVITDKGKLPKSLRFKDVKEELTNKENCIGFHEPTQTWWGWSHRAAYGFGIGSKVSKGIIGYEGQEKVANTLEEAKEMAIKFAQSVS